MDDLCKGRIGTDLSPDEEALTDAIQGGDISSARKVTWRCHGVTAWLTQTNTSVGHRYTIFQFLVLKTYMSRPDPEVDT